MYVDELTLDEAWEWEGLLREWIGQRVRLGRDHEQLDMDLEDIYAHIQYLDETECTQ